MVALPARGADEGRAPFGAGQWSHISQSVAIRYWLSHPEKAPPQLRGRFQAANRAIALARTAGAPASQNAPAAQGVQGPAVVFNKDQGGSETVLASHESGERSLAMVRFAPQANATEITRLLNAYKAQVVDGPNSAGFYSIRLTKDLTQDELTRVIKQMQDESKVVDFIATK